MNEVKEQGYKLTENDKKEILDTMKEEVEKNKNLKVLADLPSNNGVETNENPEEGYMKEVETVVDPVTGATTVLNSNPNNHIATVGKNTVDALKDAIVSDMDYSELNLNESDIKKLLESEQEGLEDKDKYSISDETVVELLSIINRYKNHEQIKYKDFPQEIKKYIDQYMKANGYGNNSVQSNTARNAIVQMMLDDYISKLEINKFEDDVNKNIEDLMKDASKELSGMLHEYNDSKDGYLEEVYNSVEDPEKKEKVKEIIDACKDGFSLTRLREAAPKIKIKRYDIENPSRMVKGFHTKYLYNQSHIYDLTMCANILGRHLIEDGYITEAHKDEVNKFILLFCKVCMNYNVNSSKDHAFMYYFTYNIILLDQYKGDDYKEFAGRYLPNVMEVIKNLR